MNSKIQALSIAIIAVVLLVTASIATPFAFAQNNQTGTLEDKLTAAKGNNTMKATAPGDEVYVLICPPGWETGADCQLFAGVER